MLFNNLEKIIEFRNSLYVYKNFPKYYPECFETKTTEEDLAYLKHYTDSSLSGFFKTLSIENYNNNFSDKHSTYYDLHEKNFQDFAIRILHEKISDFPSFEILYLKRAKYFAISTRDDLSWTGESLDSKEKQEEKKNSMNEYHYSAKLYDWCRASSEQIKEILNSATTEKPQYIVKKMDTLEAVVYAYNSLNYNDSIGWLNFANAHNVGGAYNRGKGSQEENTATLCTAIATLTLHADPKDNIKEYINKPQLGYKGMYPIKYRERHHIPPGGNYICKTKLLNVENKFDCMMIASASADFRERTSYRPEAEEIFSDSDLYDKRVMLDMEAVCLTAIKHNIKCIILGATGCGAFRHNAKIEAKLWKKTLDFYGSYFKTIIFAIMDTDNNYNYCCFNNEFGPEGKL